MKQSPSQSGLKVFLDDLVLLVLSVFVLSSFSVFANKQEFPKAPTVFNVSHGLSLTSSSPSSKFFHVSLGFLQGAKKGTILAVFRKIHSSDLKDPHSFYEARIPVGFLEILHAEREFSLAKPIILSKDHQFQVSSLLEHGGPTDLQGVGVGDEVEMAVSFSK